MKTYVDANEDYLLGLHEFILLPGYQWTYSRFQVQSDKYLLD